MSRPWTAPPPARPTSLMRPQPLSADDREAIGVLLTKKADWLTEWETDFLQAAQLRGTMTIDQQEILDTLWDDIFTGRREKQEA